MGKGVELPMDFKQLADEVATIIADLDLYSYYQLLDLSPDAGPDVVTYQYNLKTHAYQKAKRDPRCGARLQKDLVVLLDRLDEAHQVLRDRTLRQAYDRGLEEGQTRHPAVVKDRKRAERARRDIARPEDLTSARADDPYLARAVRHLERAIPEAYLRGDDEEPDDTPPPIDQDQLEALTLSMRAKLAQAGIKLRVRDDMTQDELSAIDATYLDQAVRELRHELDRDGVSLNEEGEVEDRSADAAFAGELVAKLQNELQEMGLDLFDVVEVVDRPPELDEIEAQEYVPPAAEPPPAQPAPQDPETTINISRLLSGEPEPEPEPFDVVIPLEEEPSES